MGGRGTYASGNNVPFTYKTVGKFGGIKILQGLQGKHGLPEESHKSSAYISLNSNGTVKQIRIYNKDHTARLDVEKSVHNGKLFLHAHDYVGGNRQRARDLTAEEYAKYIKYFGGK